MARRKTKADRIHERWRDDWYGVGQLLGGCHARHRARHDNVGFEADQLFRKRGNPSQIAIGISTVEGAVSSSDVTEFAHALRKSTKVSIGRRLRTSNEIGHLWPLGRYLRDPVHRPQHRNSSKAADELATLQLMGMHPLPPEPRVRA